VMQSLLSSEFMFSLNELNFDGRRLVVQKRAAPEGDHL